MSNEELRTKETKLDRCPFCGSGEAYLHHGHADITYVCCDVCGAIVSFRPNLKGGAARDAWNRRSYL
jgi:Lar family restriction alleviation protein